MGALNMAVGMQFCSPDPHSIFSVSRCALKKMLVVDDYVVGNLLVETV